MLTLMIITGSEPAAQSHIFAAFPCTSPCLGCNYRGRRFACTVHVAGSTITCRVSHSGAQQQCLVRITHALHISVVLVVALRNQER